MKTSNKAMTEKQAALLAALDAARVTDAHKNGTFVFTKAAAISIDGRSFRGLVSRGFFLPTTTSINKIYGITIEATYYRTVKGTEHLDSPDDWVETPAERPDAYRHDQSETYGTDEYWEKLRAYGSGYMGE